MIRSESEPSEHGAAGICREALRLDSLTFRDEIRVPGYQ